MLFSLSTAGYLMLAAKNRENFSVPPGKPGSSSTAVNTSESGTVSARFAAAFALFISEDIAVLIYLFTVVVLASTVGSAGFALFSPNSIFDIKELLAGKSNTFWAALFTLLMAWLLFTVADDNTSINTNNKNKISVQFYSVLSRCFGSTTYFS